MEGGGGGGGVVGAMLVSAKKFDQKQKFETKVINHSLLVNRKSCAEEINNINRVNRGPALRISQILTHFKPVSARE